MHNNFLEVKVPRGWLSMKWLTTKRVLNLKAHAKCLVWIFVSFAELVVRILWVGKDNDSLVNGSQE